MDKRDHQICELMEDAADVYNRLRAVANTVDRIGRTNVEILKEDRATIRRLEIAHLRRMADVAAAWGILAASESGGVDLSKYELKISQVGKLERFHAACLAKIDRLRGA